MIRHLCLLSVGLIYFELVDNVQLSKFQQSKVSAMNLQLLVN
jgi:hypothetical protein